MKKTILAAALAVALPLMQPLNQPVWAQAPEQKAEAAQPARSGEARAESEARQGDAQDDDSQAPPGRAPLPGSPKQRRDHQVRRRVSVAGRGMRSTPSSGGSPPISSGT